MKTKTPKKKETKEKKKTSPKKAATIKISVPKKKKDSPKKRKAEVVDSDEDDEPLVKKTKSEPTDTELRTVVSAILKNADLEQVTMKTVVKQVRVFCNITFYLFSMRFSSFFLSFFHFNQI